MCKAHEWGFTNALWIDQTYGVDEAKEGLFICIHLHRKVSAVKLEAKDNYGGVAEAQDNIAYESTAVNA